MAIIDVVRYEQQEGVIVYKFPACDLRWGTQLVVFPGQVAYFAKGGKICDKFTEGTYTLKSGNIPLLNKIVNLPFGGDSPFQADVWYVSTVSRLNLKWGTETPIQLEDPKYGIIVPVRAYGQYGFCISDTDRFMKTFIGNMPSFDEVTLQSYFRGLLLSKLTNIIADKIVRDGISVLDIPTQLQSISVYSQKELTPFFNKYGLEILLFNIISINIPEDDASLNEIKRAKNLSARLQIVGRDNYSLERSFDVMDKAAENESGTGAAFINAGLGLGVSMNLGKQTGRLFDPNCEMPPIPQETLYYLAINKQQQGPYTKQQIIGLIAREPNSINLLAWKNGMPSWSPLYTFVEFQTNNTVCPPPIPE